MKDEERRRTDVSSQNVLNLLLLKSALDDQPSRTVYGPRGAHLSKEKLDYMLGLPMHSLADLGNVGEYGFFIALPVNGWWSNRVSFPGGIQQRRVRCV
jgi:hypothetical protein